MFSADGSEFTEIASNAVRTWETAIEGFDDKDEGRHTQ